MGRVSYVLGSLTTTSLLVLGLSVPASAESQYADTDYVALGDSYSSGVGAPGQTGLCLRSRNGYPGQWAARNEPKSFVNLACTNAVTSDVIKYQLPFVSSKTDLVSITIGGNDTGFVSNLVTCTLASDAVCLKTLADARADDPGPLTAKLDDTYAGIRRKAPNARVVVLGYPPLFDTSAASCGIGGLSLAKRQALNAGNQVLNELIQERATAAGFTFADVRDGFAGHGICSGSAYLNGLTVVPPTNSYHPNQNGYTYGYLPALSGHPATGPVHSRATVASPTDHALAPEVPVEQAAPGSRLVRHATSARPRRCRRDRRPLRQRGHLRRRLRRAR